MADQPPRSRREFLVSVGAALGASAVAAACSSPVDSSSCEGYDALTPDQLATRTALDYVDESPRIGVKCTNCRFWLDGPDGSACGGCSLFAGPVAPGGYCSSWAANA